MCTQVVLAVLEIYTYIDIYSSIHRPVALVAEVEFQVSVLCYVSIPFKGAWAEWLALAYF